jgi:hypothetical protein
MARAMTDEEAALACPLESHADALVPVPVDGHVAEQRRRRRSRIRSLSDMPQLFEDEASDAPAPAPLRPTEAQRADARHRSRRSFNDFEAMRGGFDAPRPRSQSRLGEQELGTAELSQCEATLRELAAPADAGAAAGFAATISHLRAYVVGAQLGGAATLRSLLERITGFAKDFTACDAATLYLADDRDETALVMRMSTNWDAKNAARAIRIRAGQGLAGMTMMEQRPARLDDAYESKYFQARYDRESGYVTRSVLCVPLLIRRDGAAPFLLGVLQCLNKLAPAAEEQLGDSMNFDESEAPREVLIVRDGKNGASRDIAVTPFTADDEAGLCGVAAAATGVIEKVRALDKALRASQLANARRPSQPVWKPNLQPDFNVSVIERFGPDSFAVLRELDESDRFVQK